MTFTDQRLTSYLNGDLAVADAEAIETALSGDETLQRRLMALDPFAAPVADVFKALPGQERLESLRAAIPEPVAVRRSSPSWFTGAAMAASVALGAVFGSQFLPSKDTDFSDWRVEVARYQALYVPATVEFLGGDPEKLAVEMARASKAVGLELDLSSLSELEDLTLRRAQVLGFQGEPLIQLAYTDANGAPFALCIMSKPDGEQGPALLAGLATHTWESDSHGFILVGGTEQGKVDRLVGQLRSDALRSL